MMWVFEQVMKLRGALLAYHLTTVGAKSGAERTGPTASLRRRARPLARRRQPRRFAQEPAWLHNLKAHPDKVRLRIDKTTVPVTASTLGPADRDAAWERIVREAPDFGTISAAPTASSPSSG